MTSPRSDIAILRQLEKKVLWLASYMIHHANHLRDNADGLKVGGHQASSASLAAIMTALYFDVLRPQDRVAVKPHASPIFHAIQYLLGRQNRERLEAFRGYKGAQSYPSRTKDADDVDFSTGSVGLGVAQTLFSSLTQDYVRAHGWGQTVDGKARPEGRMVALVGDAELDEGNIFEAMLEGWKQGLRNCWWIIDYNRQSLDAVIREGLWERYEQLFRNFGWDVVIVKYGALQQAAFKEPGGDKLRAWIDNCPNQLYSALVFAGGAAWRKRLTDEIGDQGEVSTLIERRSDEDLAALMNNLGGHDLPALLDAFHGVKTDKPTCFICYTIKGAGLPMAGHKDNHAGLMTPAQMDAFRQAMRVREGHEWDRFEGLDTAPEALQAFLDRVPFARDGARRFEAPQIAVPADLPVTIQPVMSTQTGFGALLNEIGKNKTALAERIVTTSPDVTVSTNLGPWVNRRKLFARTAVADTFRNERIPSTFTWEFSPQGQHLELGIAEMNLFIALSALGLSHAINGVRLLPIGTLYDPFIARGLDALNYACYQDARFIAVGTPSGITLAGEGGAHQSIAEPLIGLAQDGLAAFEPAYVDELATIMAWSLAYIQKSGGEMKDSSSVGRPDAKPDSTFAGRPPLVGRPDAKPDSTFAGRPPSVGRPDAKPDSTFAGRPPERTWLRDETGGSVYLRLSTRPIDQIQRAMTDDLKRDIVDGAYWMRRPGPNAEVVVAYAGTIAPEAIEAVGLMAEDRRDIGLLAVTSADRLNAGWTAAQRARERGLVHARSHIERLLADVPQHCGMVTVLDGHPATLAWLGAVGGHRTRSLGVEHFGQTGSLAELYRHYGIDANAIVAAAQAIAPGRPIRHLKALP